MEIKNKRYDQYKEKEDQDPNKVSFSNNSLFHNKQILPNSKEAKNFFNPPQNVEDKKESSFPKKHKIEKNEVQNIQEKTQPKLTQNISQSQEAKMDIEIMNENLIGSLSTQDSKNVHLSNDSNFNLINLNFANSHNIPSTNPNLLLYEEQKMNIENVQSPKQSQDKEPNQDALEQLPISNHIEKQLTEEGNNMITNDEKKNL